MTTDANPTGQGDLTKFDAAQSSGVGSPICTSCSKQITDRYHEANGAIVCSKCRAAIEAELKGGRGAGGFARAFGFGLAGAALGALLYFAVVKLTGYEIGLIAIAVGFMVGRGVQMGARGRGGWKFQTLAIALTYSAIVATYIPFLAEELRDGFPGASAVAADSLAAANVVATAEVAGVDDATLSPASDDLLPANADASTRGLGTTVVALLLLFAMAALLPVLAGVDNIIGLAIIGFALYQAWSMNKRVVMSFTGPYRVGAPAPNEGPAAA